MAEYMNPNDTKNEKGEVVPQNAEKVAARLKKLQETTEPGDISGYVVAYPWTYTRDGEPPHKKGEKLDAKAVHTPSGRDRDDHIAELVQNGNLVPEYATSEARKHAEMMARNLTPREWRDFLKAEAEAAGKQTERVAVREGDRVARETPPPTQGNG